jgi:hypothetical protein
VELLILVNLGVDEFDNGRYKVGNIDYGTLGDLQVDFLQLVRMPTWITLYWMKEVMLEELTGYKFFSKDEVEQKPCKTMDVKMMLLFLLVFWGYKILRMKFL